MDTMNLKQHDLVQLLRRFNRKERYWLVVDALGQAAAQLSDVYRRRLGGILGIEVPCDAWWAMDYHFDWLHAALFCLSREVSPDALGVQSNTDTRITGSQEDIDLIVAFDKTLILIEAKGIGAWSREQIKSKTSRIKTLPALDRLDIRLVLASPRAGPNIMSLDWTDIPPSMLGPDGKPFHMPLDGFGGSERLLRVSRCEKEGNPNAAGGHWIIRPQSRSADSGN